MKPAVTVLLLSVATITQSQIVLDGTMGTHGALSGPAFTIPATVGQTRGGNLFHSFSQFNIGTAESATFTGPDTVHNVIARVTGIGVTGVKTSTINGALNCEIPGANFFFINPFGVIFGEHATVNVSGSFAVTTADYVKLADGGRFDAHNPGNDVLTTAPVSAFGFLGPTAAPISVAPPNADVDPFLFFLPEGKSFWLIGGNVDIAGRYFGTPAGASVVVSVASAGELAVDVDAVIPPIDASGFATLGTLTFGYDTLLYTAGSAGGGPIWLEADRIESGVGFTAVSYNFGGTQAGNVDVRARTAITASGSLFDASGSDGGPGGDVTFIAPQIHLTGTNIGTGTDSTGGNIRIVATEFTLSSGTQIFAAGGSLHIDTGLLRLEGDDSGKTLLNTSSFGGIAGSIDIHAQTVEIVGLASIISEGIRDGRVGGGIRITTDTLTAVGGNFDGLTGISTRSVESGGGGGDIIINARQISLADNAQITAASENAAPAGSILINVTDSLHLQSGAAIRVTSLQGAGGDITITAGNKIQLFDSSLSAQANLDGGNIHLTAQNEVYLLNSQIKAESTLGNGGNITIDPTFVVLNHSSLIANAIAGNGGNITIESRYFFVSDSLIDASSQFGLPGTVTINALNFDASGNLVTLPGNLLDAESRLRPHCAIRLPRGASSFTLTGRSQLPVEPDGLLPAYP